MAASMWTDLANQAGERFAVPPALLLSLIDMESGGDPNSVNPVSNATGLMQVTKIVLKDYNQRHNKNLSLEDIKDPETNISIGAELLRRISLTYEKYNKLPPLWGNRAYVAMIVLGWNAGYSNASGVSYILSQLQEKNIGKERWSLDLISQAASNLPKASPFLREPRRILWSRKVIDRYMGIEKEEAKKLVAEAKPGLSGGTKVLLYGGLGAAALGAGYFLLSGKEESEESPGTAPIVINFRAK